MLDNESLVYGVQVQKDMSNGQGHCWRNVDAADLPANIREEIECEIIDGGKESRDRFHASNGLYYSW